MIVDEEVYLEHFGVKGMRWGVRNSSPSRVGKRPDRLDPKKSDSEVTKNVKKDYNDLNNRTFFKKYATTKRTYANRVKKYGDPYLHAVEKRSAKAGGSKKRETQVKNYDEAFKRQERKRKAITAATVAGVIYMNSPKVRQTMKKTVWQMTSSPASVRLQAKGLANMDRALRLL